MQWAKQKKNGKNQHQLAFYDLFGVKALDLLWSNNLIVISRVRDGWASMGSYKRDISRKADDQTLGNQGWLIPQHLLWKFQHQFSPKGSNIRLITIQNFKAATEKLHIDENYIHQTKIVNKETDFEQKFLFDFTICNFLFRQMAKPNLEDFMNVIIVNFSKKSNLT